MVRSFSSLAALAALTVVTTTADDPEILIHQKELSSPACGNPKMRDALYEKYHSDGACDRMGYNDYVARLRRQDTHTFFQKSKRHGLVPERTTVTCPSIVQDLYTNDQERGYDSNWIVENKASVPVVLAWVDPETGIEYSARDGTITPPQLDPHAILPPGHWLHLHTFEGHVFHAREMLDDGTTGNVLLQHREGLIPVGELAAKDGRLIGCSLDDPEPLIEVPKPDQPEDVDVIIAPKFQRTTLKPLIDCNQIAIGFRNKAGCPLHGYFVQDRTCHEVFKLHLGVTPADQSRDFHHDWVSNTGFETSFVGHSFVFRSAHDPSILVDRIDIKTTQIVDCPDLKQQTTAARVPQKIAMPISRQDAAMARHSNSTTAGNSTLSNGATAPGASNYGITQEMILSLAGMYSV